jgi:hypothetical protein
VSPAVTAAAAAGTSRHIEFDIEESARLAYEVHATRAFGRPPRADKTGYDADRPTSGRSSGGPAEQFSGVRWEQTDESVKAHWRAVAGAIVENLYAQRARQVAAIESSRQAAQVEKGRAERAQLAPVTATHAVVSP